MQYVNDFILNLMEWLSCNRGIIIRIVDEKGVRASLKNQITTKYFHIIKTIYANSLSPI